MLAPTLLAYSFALPPWQLAGITKSIASVGVQLGGKKHARVPQLLAASASAHASMTAMCLSNAMQNIRDRPLLGLLSRP